MIGLELLRAVEDLGRSQGTYSRLHKQWRDALDDGRLTITDLDEYAQAFNDVVDFIIDYEG